MIKWIGGGVVALGVAWVGAQALDTGIKGCTPNGDDGVFLHMADGSQVSNRFWQPNEDGHCYFHNGGNTEPESIPRLDR